MIFNLNPLFSVSARVFLVVQAISSPRSLPVSCGIFGHQVNSVLIHAASVFDFSSFFLKSMLSPYMQTFNHNLIVHHFAVVLFSLLPLIVFQEIPENNCHKLIQTTVCVFGVQFVPVNLIHSLNKILKSAEFFRDSKVQRLLIKLPLYNFFKRLESFC